MGYETVRLERRGRIAVITLNRPDKLNAINRVMEDELQDVIRELDADDDVGVLVLTGAGRAFCSGGDISEFPSSGSGTTDTPPSPDDIRRGFRGSQGVILGLQRMQKPGHWHDKWRSSGSRLRSGLCM